MSGRSRTTRRSKRPGRRSAGSRMSGRLVAAMTMTLVLVSKPSISTSIWLSVCSRSSWPPPRPAPRCRPTASISSTKTMDGELRFAWSKRSRTRDAPTPTNISTNSEPLMEKNGTPASPATALLSRVLPMPGGPTISTPLGMCAPSARKRSGYLRNSTTSCNSVLDSSTPATSENMTVGRLPVFMRARLLPNPSAWLLLPCACRIMKSRMAPKKMSGRNCSSIPKRFPSPPLRCTCTSIPCSTGSISAAWRISKMLVPGSLAAVSSWLVWRMVATMRSPSTTRLDTCPLLAVARMVVRSDSSPSCPGENSMKNTAMTATKMMR